MGIFKNHREEAKKLRTRHEGEENLTLEEVMEKRRDEQYDDNVECKRKIHDIKVAELEKEKAKAEEELALSLQEIEEAKKADNPFTYAFLLIMNTGLKGLVCAIETAIPNVVYALWEVVEHYDKNLLNCFRGATSKVTPQKEYTEADYAMMIERWYQNRTEGDVALIYP